MTASSSSSGSQHDVEKKSVEESIVRSDIPDGGCRAWSVLLGVWLIQFCTFGYISAFGVYNDFYVRTYLTNYSPSQISWIGSLQLFLLSFLGGFTGRAYDAGYFHYLTIGGSLIFTFSLFMLSLTREQQYYQVFLSQALGMGLGAGMLEIPTYGVLMQYFDNKRAFALGVATSAGAVGGAIHPILLNHLIFGRVGFHNGVRASAGLCTGILILGICLVKQRHPPEKRKLDVTGTVKGLVTDLPWILITMGATLVALSIFFPIFFVQLNAIKNGITPQLAFYTVTMINAGGAVGRIVPTLFVRRFGVYNLVTATLWVLVILIFCTLAVKDAAGTVAFAILYGFFSGAYIGLVLPLLATTARDDTELGTRFGSTGSISGVSLLVGNPIAGALLTSSFIWWRGFLYAGLCIAAGNVCYLCARQLAVKKRGTQVL